ncbi:hypothetical protein WN093_04670 [Gammaproteobacteria bacterium AS21]
MKKYFQFPSSSRGIIALFIILLIAYGMIGLWLIPSMMFEEWSIVEQLFAFKEVVNENGVIEKVSIAGDLFVSFTASALQDILFFVIIGLVLFVFSMKNPENDSLSQKLTYLFPVAKDDSVLRAYLERSVNKLGCMSDETSFVFTLLEYNQDKKIFKIQVHFESHIRNLHNKDSFSDPMLAMNLSSDLVDEPPNSIYGQLEHVKVYNFSDGSISNINGEAHDYPVNMMEKVFRHSCPFSLPPHAVALFDAKHWEWSPAHKVHNLRLARFTRHVNFICVNSTQHSVSIDLSRINSDEEPQTYSLGKHESQAFKVIEAQPGDGIKIIVDIAG